jgi:hypothetical protein
MAILRTRDCRVGGRIHFLELTRKHYREAGLDARKLDLLVRQLGGLRTFGKNLAEALSLLSDIQKRAQ